MTAALVPAPSPTKERTPAARDLPHSLESEQAVLGAILSDDTAFDQVAATLHPRDFYRLEHRHVYEACVELAREVKTLDAVMVQQRLDAKGLLGGAVPRELPFSLQRAVGTTANVAHYARAVKDLARLRGTMLAAQQVLEDGYNAGGNVEAFLAEATSLVETAAAPEPTTLAACLRASEGAFADELRERRSGARQGSSTGLAELDARLEGGLSQGFYTLAAPPGAGKTTLALQVAEHAARAGRAVLFMALEMPRWDLESRLVAARLGWAWPKVRGARYLDEREIAEVLSARALLSEECPALEIVEVGHGQATVDHIATEVARMGSDRPPIVIVDYLQALAPDTQWRGDRRNAVGHNAYRLKTLSTETKAPILALLSVSRDWYGKDVSDKPKSAAGFLAAGKEAGECEYAADVAMYLDVDEADRSGIAQGRIAVAKIRGGSPGFVPVSYDGARGRFSPAPRRERVT